MGLTQLNFDNRTKVDVALLRIQEFEPEDGYYLAFSGGKDSIVIYDLAAKADVRFDAHYNLTGIDPPELVRFIKDRYPHIDVTKPPKTIWNLIPERGMPRRKGRWCCEELKEFHGDHRRVLTGVRWAESIRRRRRTMFELCHRHPGKSYLHPIIDWTNDEVWEYIDTYTIPYCSLYDEGFRRLGCVLCPMTTPKTTIIEAKRWPKIADAWRRAAYRYYDRGTEGVKRWDSPEAFWQWWLSRRAENTNDAQCVMFE